jgi:hypothetical protein
MFTFEVPTDPDLLRISLKDPVSFQASVCTTGETRVIWDSCVSILVTPSMEDFVGPFSTTTLHDELQGLAKGLNICGQESHVLWAFLDSTGALHHIKVPASYVPETQVRLLSTTSLLQSYQLETIFMEDFQLTLS